MMPCLNEAETLDACLQKAFGFLRRHQIDGEVIVADNGSTDGSLDIAQRHGAKIVRVEQKGYGSAVMGGIHAAQGTYIIMGDADDSYDFSTLMPFLEQLRAGSDMVIGNRFRGGIAAGAMPFLHRYLGNPVLTAIGRIFFNSPCKDFHCGLRGFSRAAVVCLGLTCSGMEFASELIVKAHLKGLTITEVPTTLTKAGRSRPPHLKTWRDGWRHLRFLLLYSPRWLFLYPGLLLMACGLLVGAWLLPGDQTIGTVTLGVHTLLYASLAIIIGFQSVIFAVFTKVFAITAGLLPEDPWLEKAFHVLTLEVGLLIGTLLVGGGLFGSIYAVNFWKGRAFGALDPSETLRFVIPAFTALALGCQTILSSFFLSVLGLKR